jgi:hypothetical protein
MGLTSFPSEPSGSWSQELLWKGTYSLNLDTLGVRDPCKFLSLGTPVPRHSAALAQWVAASGNPLGGVTDIHWVLQCRECEGHCPQKLRIRESALWDWGVWHVWFLWVPELKGCLHSSCHPSPNTTYGCLSLTGQRKLCMSTTPPTHRMSWGAFENIMGPWL